MSIPANQVTYGPGDFEPEPDYEGCPWFLPTEAAETVRTLQDATRYAIQRIEQVQAATCTGYLNDVLHELRNALD